MYKFIAVTVAIVGTLASSAQAGADDPNFYANQLPYGNADSSAIQAPPAGYNVFFLENVGRHGSRTMTSSATETRALSVWSAANTKHALRPLGETFDDDVKAFQEKEVAITYADLTDQGKDELNGIGRRTADEYPAFFAGLNAASDTIAFRTTSAHRTQQSADAMRAGIEGEVPGLTYLPKVTDNTRLLLGNGVSTNGKVAIAKALKAPNVRTAANDVLHGLYTQAYVNTLSDPVGKALDIYLIYSTAPSLVDPVTFAKYVPLADAQALAYASDAKNFYSYGPGVTGETSSYKSARPLLKDFFTRLDSRIAGGKTAAVFRLAHGETTMPFEALIKVPGSGTQVKKGYVYKWGSNPWRGSVAGRLAGNVEWAAYRNSAGKVLVTMRYNEKPVKFPSACKPSASNPYFYGVYTLKHCLG